MILLVEDNEDDIFIMERAMQKTRRSPSLQVAVNGREALNYLQGVNQYADRVAHPIPSLIFLDLKLPFVHGFEVLQWINQQSSLAHVPVVILSSSPEERDREKARALGAKDFLVKPPTAAILNQTLQKYIPTEGG
jgi:CheY-like chemotaxis protein